eukprot:5461800-Amphidinium_carterae.2
MAALSSSVMLSASTLHCVKVSGSAADERSLKVNCFTKESERCDIPNPRKCHKQLMKYVLGSPCILSSTSTPNIACARKE